MTPPTYDDDLQSPIPCPSCGRRVVHGEAGATACGAPPGQCRFGPDYARPSVRIERDAEGLPTRMLFGFRGRGR